MARIGVASLNDVARRCAVNPSTVSRVLNNSTHGRFSVSPQVRQKILDAAREMNYRPSAAARNQRLTKTKLVAVLGNNGIYSSDHVGPIEEAVGMLADTLDRAGYEICLQLRSKRHAPFDMPPLRVDGVVAVGPCTQEDVDALDKMGVPYVSLNGRVGLLGSAVNPDDAQGTRLAVKHLADLGHRRIAYLDYCTSNATHQSVVERRQAFHEATAAHNLEVPTLNLELLTPGTSWTVYYEPFLRNAIVAGKATAVLAYSHHAAMGLCRRAHDLGINVPNDFSLVCFNNEPVVQVCIPSITAIDLPSHHMGQMAAEILLRAMNSLDPVPPAYMRLGETLIARESSAPPPR